MLYETHSVNSFVVNPIQLRMCFKKQIYTNYVNVLIGVKSTLNNNIKNISSVFKILLCLIILAFFSNSNASFIDIIIR